MCMIISCIVIFARTIVVIVIVLFLMVSEAARVQRVLSCENMQTLMIADLSVCA